MFRLEKIKDKRVLKSSIIDDKTVEAFFTTRDLPLKAGEREDLAKEVEKNKEFLCEVLAIRPESLFIPVQTHSDNVGVIKSEQVKAKKNQTPKVGLVFSPKNIDLFGLLRRIISRNNVNCENFSSLFENTDALVTNLSNVAIALNFADCVPVILYDPSQKVAAIAHAGWKGTASKIVKKTVSKMEREFMCSPKDIVALIGPAIGKCCFEVKEDVAQKLLETIDLKEHGAVYENSHIELKRVNKFQLLSSGVEKIDVCEYCTCCKTDLFFSYRKENRNTARHSAVIMLK